MKLVAVERKVSEVVEPKRPIQKYVVMSLDSSSSQTAEFNLEEKLELKSVEPLITPQQQKPESEHLPNLPLQSDALSKRLFLCSQLFFNPRLALKDLH